MARRQPVTLFSLGPFRWKAGLPSLAEIGAGAFAQRFLGLRVHPDWIVRAAMEHSKTGASFGVHTVPDVH